MRTDMLTTALQMTRIPSVNGTAGEKDIALYLEERLREIPYFGLHPDQIIIQPLAGDPLGRRNVIAYVKGQGDDTILLHGHTDTVGVEDYGVLEPYAFDPESLMAQLENMDLPAEVRKDLRSGDYLFGRGICDMKSGDAVFLHIIEELSWEPERLHGNVVVSFNPVEENQHTGMIQALDVLLELQEKKHFHYILAINNDYTCPLYAGDDEKTIYTGAAGKVLPCFYVQGAETHVGQCYEGLDASSLAAALVSAIHLNPDFADVEGEEAGMPPSVLKLKDGKAHYNVQTAKEALVYFNYFVLHSSFQKITDRLLKAAEKAFMETLQAKSRSQEKYRQITHADVSSPACTPYVLSYEDLLAKAENSDAYDEEHIRQIIAEEKQKGTDVREIPCAIIRYLLGCAGIVQPVIVLYYAPPYCPHNVLGERQKPLLAVIRKAVAETSAETGDHFRIHRYYPSLSDSSYLSIDDDEASLAALARSFPAMEKLYPLPIDKIRRLHIPAVNYGAYGKDAHKWTERVNVPYTFGTLPILIEKTIDALLKGEKS